MMAFNAPLNVHKYVDNGAIEQTIVYL